ncbi:MAG: class I SAM-dependent methyltransferase [Acidimicrobiia bacterium]
MTPRRNDWNAATYGDGFADVYDDWYADVTDIEGTVAEMVRLGGPILELGIGTGRLALAMTDAGLEVHGVDASRAMVDKLRTKPGGEHIPVLVADMSAELPAGPFATILVAYNTLFNLYEPGQQERLIALAATRLAPGGHLVIEAAVPSDPSSAATKASGDTANTGRDGDRSDQVRVRSIEPDRVVLSVSVFDGRDNTALGQFVDISADGITMRPWRIRMATPAELDAMAARAGLQLISRTSSWDGAEFDMTSTLHISTYRQVTTRGLG